MTDTDLRDLESRFLAGETLAGDLLLGARARAGLCVFHGEPSADCAVCAEVQAIDWAGLFADGWSRPEPAATEAEVRRLVEGLPLPVSEEEVQRLEGWHGSLAGMALNVAPRDWVLPSRPLPPAYLSFLRWSNGGNFRRGDREFGFFSTHDVREFLLSYFVPDFMPQAVPLAFDGGSTFYLLDTRLPPRAGEYPILFSPAGSLGFAPDDCTLVAESFLGLCQGTTDPHEDPESQSKTYPELVDVWLVRRPPGGLKSLLAIKSGLKLQESIVTLKSVYDAAPARLLSSVPFFPHGVLCARVNSNLPGCLEVREVGANVGVDLSDLA